MPILLMFLLSSFAFDSGPKTYQCTNSIEIICDNEKCQNTKEGEFTPMSVSFDEKGAMSVCAYSGCWEGKAKISKNGNFWFFSGEKFKFSTAPENGESYQDIGLVFDTKDSVALLKAGSYAHPMTCAMKTD